MAMPKLLVLIIISALKRIEQRCVHRPGRMVDLTQNTSGNDDVERFGMRSGGPSPLIYVTGPHRNAERS